MAPAALVAAVAHELAHAWVAFRCGDATAARAGRLSMNPMAHADLFGTILLPLVTGSLLGAPIGWLKPLPVNFHALTWRQAFLVAAAGPAANLVLAGASSFTLCVAAYTGAAPLCLAMIAWSVKINLVLAAFNLLPVMPLDGARMLTAWNASRGKLQWFTE